MTIRGKLRLIAGVIFLVILLMTGVTYVLSGTMLDNFLKSSGTEIAVNAANIVQDQLDRYIMTVNIAATAMRQSYIDAANPELGICRIDVGLAHCGRGNVHGHDITVKLILDYVRRIYGNLGAGALQKIIEHGSRQDISDTGHQ